MTGFCSQFHPAAKGRMGRTRQRGHFPPIYFFIITPGGPEAHISPPVSAQLPLLCSLSRWCKTMLLFGRTAIQPADAPRITQIHPRAGP